MKILKRKSAGPRLLMTLFSICIGFGPVHAQVPLATSAASAGGTNADYGYVVTVDPTGNCFVTGYFTGTATFGSTNIASAAELEMFVAKYDSACSLLWVLQAAGTIADQGLGVASDSAGNCYVTGLFSGSAFFGSTNLVTAGTNGASDMFVAKYNGAGDLVWVRQAGGNGSDFGQGIVVDTKGNVYVSGGYVPPASFGNLTLNGVGNFLAKYDPNGNLMWAKDNQLNELKALALDAQGNLFGAGSAIVGSSSTIVVSKYDGDGNPVWSVGPYRAGAWPAGITVDPFGNAMVTGNFLTQIATKFYPVCSLAKFSSTGKLLWMNQVGGTNGTEGDGITSDSLGNCYVCGRFSGSALFGKTNLVSLGFNDDFVAKYDGLGNLLWVLQMGGSEDDLASGMAWHPSKGLYVTGGFSGRARFGNTVLTNMGGPDIFLARIVEVPVLAVNSATNHVILSWPTNQSEFLLERATNVFFGAVWSPLTNTVQVESDRNVVTDRISSGASFYRLRKQ